MRLEARARAAWRLVERERDGRAPRRRELRALRVREDVGAERAQPGRAGVAEVWQREDVLDAPEHRVVVVLLLGDGSRLDVPRQQYGADPPAAGARRGPAVVGRARPLLLAAARVGVVLLGLVEGDDEEPAVAVGGRVEDPRDPALEEPVGAHEAAGLAVDARLVVTVVAEVGRDERVGGRRARGLEV